MLRKGYLEQQVEGLSIALGRLLLLKAKNDPVELLREIRTSGKELLGLDPATLISLSDDTLLLLCSAHGILDAGKAAAAGALLDQQAQTQQAMGNRAAAFAGWQKALFLLTEALDREEKLRTDDFLSMIESIRADLPAELPVEMLRRLLGFYELVGQYAHAEDILYSLREKHPGPETSAEAVAFYERLLKLPDDALEAGNLPREEIQEALATIEG